MAERDKRGFAEAIGLAWSLGWRVAAGTWIGYRLDLWMNSGGVLTLVFALAAMVTGVRALMRAGRIDSDGADHDAANR